MDRILFYIPSLTAGGGERVCANLANHWAADGRKVIVATLSEPETDYYKLHPAVERRSLGLLVTSNHIVSALARNMKRTWRLRRLLYACQPDVAIAFMTTSNIWLALARVGLKSVICIGSEHIYPPKEPLGPIWERLRAFSYRNLDAVMALTESSAAWLKTHTSARRIVVIPNPISHPLPDQPPYVPPEFVGQPGRKRLLAIGRLTGQKGFDLLIRAYHLLHPHHPDWELVILGEGELRPDLECLIERLRLKDAVYLPGVVGNVGDWLRSADLFVLSSRYEGFGNVLVEALNHGVPVVSFDCESGPGDIVRHEVDGLLVPAGDGSALVAALHRLMEDDDLRRSYALRAVEARQRFSLQEIVSRWERLFRELRSGES